MEKKEILQSISKEFKMGNFKHPQYLTPNGLVRSVKKPGIKPIRYVGKVANANVNVNIEKTFVAKAPSKLQILAQKRAMAKRILQRQEKGLSEHAAKVIAEAIKTMLHS